MTKFAAMNGVGAMIVQVILHPSLVSALKVFKYYAMLIRLTEFEMESQ